MEASKEEAPAAATKAVELKVVWLTGEAFAVAGEASWTVARHFTVSV